MLGIQSTQCSTGRQFAKSFRTLLISDLHLGCKHSQATQCLQFLQSYRPKRLYSVGDVIDAWKVNKGWHWSPECDQILEHLKQLLRDGAEVFYVPGNHDAFLRSADYLQWLPRALAEVRIAEEFVFETASGRRFLITHGDRFDWNHVTPTTDYWN